MTIKLILKITMLLFMVIIVTTSCSSGETTIQDTTNQDDTNIEDKADISGIISEIEIIDNNTVEGRILVELDEPNNTSDKFWVTIENNTPVYQFDTANNDLVAFSSLRNGQTLEVWFEGAVMESYPAQVKAKQVLIVP